MVNFLKISKKAENFLNRKKRRKLVSTLIITIIVFMAFSIPISILPGLGNILFPPYGIWNATGEVPEEEHLVISGLQDDVVVYRKMTEMPIKDDDGKEYYIISEGNILAIRKS